MNKTQLKFLTKYLGKNGRFTSAQDKQDLLEAVIRNGEWELFEIHAMFACPTRAKNYTKWLIQLSPQDTAKLVCQWEGVK